MAIRASGTSSQVRISAMGKNRRIPRGAHVRDRKAARVQEESIAESGSEYSLNPERMTSTNCKFSSEAFLELICCARTRGGPPHQHGYRPEMAPSMLKVHAFRAEHVNP
jgi:hypothetical protein